MGNRIHLITRSIGAATAAAALVGCSMGKEAPLEEIQLGSYADPPQTVSLKIEGYKPGTGRAFENVFVSNFSVRVSRGRLQRSSSRDGMDDGTKLRLTSQYGFDASKPESAKAGFLDLFLFNIGATIAQQTVMYCAQTGASSDDAFTYPDSRLPGSPIAFLGLRDCQKSMLGLDPNKFDTAGNGIPDYMKLRCGMNLANRNAAYVSAAGDSIPDIEKCKRGIPLDESAGTQPNTVFALRYSSQLTNGGTTRDLFVENIPVLDDGDGAFIAIYLVESDLTTGGRALFSRFAILNGQFAGKRLRVPWWGSLAEPARNQPLLVSP